jgi:hypothetical protein
LRVRGIAELEQEAEFEVLFIQLIDFTDFDFFGWAC